MKTKATIIYSMNIYEFYSLHRNDDHFENAIYINEHSSKLQVLKCTNVMTMKYSHFEMKTNWLRWRRRGATIEKRKKKDAKELMRFIWNEMLFHRHSNLIK